MSEMIKQVAAAIVEIDRLVEAGRIGVDASDFPSEPLARAAIETLREPTDAMVLAGINLCGLDCWQAMIDAALAER